MEIKEEFLNGINLNNLNKILAKKLNIQDRESYNACRELLKKHMTNIFKQNASKLKSMPTNKALSSLNKLSIQSSYSYYKDRMNSKQSSNTKSKQRQGDSNELLNGMDTGYGSYAPLSSGPGEFIAADGSIGKHFITGVNNNELLQTQGRKESKGTLDEIMQERMMSYDVGGYGGQGISRGPPQEIDFSLDGSGIRKTHDKFGNPINQSKSNEYENNEYDTNTHMNFTGYENSGYGDNLNYGMIQHGDYPMSAMSDTIMPSYNNMNNMNNSNNTNNEFMMQMMQMMQQILTNQSMNEQQPMQNTQMGNYGMNSISKLNDEIKTSFAPKLGINPQSLLKMSSSEIEKLVKNKIKEQKTKIKKHKNVPKELSTDELIKTLLEKKTKNLKNKNNLNKNVSSIIKNISKKYKKNKNKDDSNTDESDKSDESDNEVSSESNNEVSDNDTSTDTSSDTNTSTNTDTSTDKSVSEHDIDKETKTNKTVQKTILKPKILPRKQEEIKSSKTVIGKVSTTNKTIVPSNKTTMQTNKKQPIINKSKSTESETKKDYSHDQTVKMDKIKEHNILCKCNDIEEDKLNYNDYYIDFETLINEQIKNVCGIEIETAKFEQTNKINETNNKLSIKYNNETNELCYPEDVYTIDEIIELFNDSMTDLNWNIQMNNKNDIITIINTDNDEFDILNTDDTILYHLGFYKTNYTKLNKYIGNIVHSFGTDPKYLFLNNISNVEPYIKINCDGTIEKLKDFKLNISVLSGLVIHIKYKNTIDDKLANMAGYKHSFNLCIKYCQ